MDAALIASAALLGAAGTPHCAAMCGAACAAVTRRGQGAGQVAFHVARIAGYTLTGAVAAASVGTLAKLGQWSPAFKPLWTLLHVAAFALGVWLLVKGRQPQWLERLGSSGRHLAPQAGGWQRLRGPGEAALAGGLWFAWPCGLLQSALVIAALTDTPAAGAAAMGAFAVASGTGLALGPWLWMRLGGSAAAAASPLAVRAAGALLVAASGWALGHGLWSQVYAYCFG